MFGNANNWILYKRGAGYRVVYDTTSVEQNDIYQASEERWEKKPLLSAEFQNVGISHQSSYPPANLPSCRILAALKLKRHHF